MDVSGTVEGVTGAFVLPDGTRIWLQDALFHRAGAPAVIRPDGTAEWWWHGWLHRADGPAIVGPGRREWWEHGRPSWPDGEPIAPGAIPLDDYSCLAGGAEASPGPCIPAQRTIDLRDRRRSRVPWRRSSHV